MLMPIYVTNFKYNIKYKKISNFNIRFYKHIYITTITIII